MKITFKNVGHGDSIILEWDNTKGERCIGLIDCCKISGRNPVVDYLTISGYKKITFLILSHPHADHYSGFPELLQYCEMNRVPIEVFGFTILPSLLKILQDISSRADFVNFGKTMRLLDSLYSKGVIKKIVSVDESNAEIVLNSNEMVKVLAPGYDEQRKIIDHHARLKSKADFNIISVILLIVSSANQKFALTTSDTTGGTLDKICNAGSIPSVYELAVGQVPHHGSKNNHSTYFWKKINYQKKKSVAVFSTGISVYELPDESVVEAFKKLDYALDSTNFVYGLAKSTSPDHSSALDSFSVLVEEIAIGTPSGDRQFII